METARAAACPACGSADVANRRWRLWVVAIIMPLVGVTLVIDGIVDGWTWLNIGGLIGLAMVALVNALAAVAAPYQCAKCRHVWH